MRILMVVLLFLSTSSSFGKITHEPPPASEKMTARKPAAWYNWFWKRPPSTEGRGNPKKWKFPTATKKAAQIAKFNPITIYCKCAFSGKDVDLNSCGFGSQNVTDRTAKIEWEHIAPAESFGQSFKLWRDGDPKLCWHKRKKFAYKGRPCAEKDPEFLRMSTDLYNLWPIIGELNAIRSNMTMGEVAGPSEYNFGGCKVKIADRKFEPEDEYKGIVARTHMYMDWAYPGHGIISNKNEKLFQAWSEKYPVTDWECQRNDLIEEIQGNPNPIVKEACAKMNH